MLLKCYKFSNEFQDNFTFLSQELSKINDVINMLQIFYELCINFNMKH